MTRYYIVSGVPTDEMYADGKNAIAECKRSGLKSTAAYCYTAMLSAAPPFVWPEEAVEAASRAGNPKAWELIDNPPKNISSHRDVIRESEINAMNRALNAALKVLEGRDDK